LPAYGIGRVEVQDAGSQLVTLAGGAAARQHVIDLCAGGGGKTLALAAAMENRAAILACDIDRGRLRAHAPGASGQG
jgi:16S rRNA (cytosine967-C5)-methyltransferase